MNTDRECRQLTIDRQMDAKRLQAGLSQIMSEMDKDPAPEAAPIRLESVLIEPNRTTVFFSGNGAGLDALTTAIGNRYPEASVAAASREDARLEPPALTSRSAE